MILHLAKLLDENKLDIPKIGANGATLQEVLRLVFAAGGSIAVLIIAIAGFQYVISQGDAQRIAKAKNTIIYAMVGLVIIISAFAIVSFIVGKVTL